MGKSFGVSTFTQSGSEPFPVNVEGTRFCLAKSSAPEVCIDFGSGWLKMPRRGAVRLPEMVNLIKIKSVDGSPVRGEIWYGDAEVDFAGAEVVRTDNSKVYQSGAGFLALVDKNLNTHGMTIYFAHLRSVSDVPYMYLTDPTVVLMYGGNGGRFLPAPLEVGPSVGVNVFNDSGIPAVASMFYELH